MKNCLKCNKELIKRDQNKFCSRSCSASYTNLRKPSRLKPDQIIKCLNCDNTVIRRPNEIKKGLRLYCSCKCATEYKVKQKNKEKSILFAQGKLKQRPYLRKFIIDRDGYKCSCCNNTEWLNKPIPLWLDHIDGNASNNSPTNLRMICLNCDALGNTFGNKNKGKGRRSLGLKPWA